MIKIGIIATGDDILKGITLNTNFNHIAKKISEIGGEVIFEISVPDDEERIKEGLKFLKDKVNGIIIIGGLGPTHDDRTREGISKFLKIKPFFDKNLWEELKKIEPNLNKERDFKYAWNFKNFKLLDNPNGIAKGYFYENKNFFLFSLPGPPKEFIPMVENYVLPYLKKKIKKKYEIIRIRTFGLKEIEIMEKIKGKEEFLKPMSILPKDLEVEIVLYGKKEEINKKLKFLRKRLKDFIVSEKGERVEEVLGKFLRKRNLTISTAESCTGGLIGDIITRVSGSSDYYKGGIIAYNEDIKVNILNVKKENIEKYTVYSEEVALEMAENVRKIFNTDIGISTTGIAGPKGGTKDKPVGLIYMGISFKDKNYVFKEIFKGEREDIKMKASLFILNKLLKILKEEK
ncbi:MAG: nicotinamide-nucleotide amidohydrolase family protein [candidate division WOR-3 bacterium]